MISFLKSQFSNILQKGELFLSLLFREGGGHYSSYPYACCGTREYT